METVKDGATAVWKDSRTKMFGSHALGLALPENPIDIVILGVKDFPAAAITAG